MPKGLKGTSSLITVGARIVESGANTFTSQRVDLQLNPLDNEVFVVLAIDIDARFPEYVATKETVSTMMITTTEQSKMPTFDSSNVMAQKVQSIDDSASVGGVYMETNSTESPSSLVDYLGIISTNDFFLNLEGFQNTGALSGACKVYGYRARADAAIYAALVQSEVLSS